MEEPQLLPDTQDRSSEAWYRLLELIDKAAEDSREEFNPAKELGREVWSQITTLPEAISKLKAVKHLMLYGSNLTRIPPQIGEMESLEKFTPYTSYGLKWFPYELTRCKNLKDSTVSTRALYGNYKFRLPFPDVAAHPVFYYGKDVHCSVCGKSTALQTPNQFWISLRVATDVLPLLVDVCTLDCLTALPSPPKNYIQVPHKGGLQQVQPDKEF